MGTETRTEIRDNNIRVLVTGAYGFLGRYTVVELLNNGYTVVAYGRNMQKLLALKDNITEQFKSNGKELRASKLILYIGDFTDYENIQKATRRVDYVVHAGALSTVWGFRKNFMNTNVKGTMNVVKACNKNGIKRIIYISSPSIYCTDRDMFNIKEEDARVDNKLSYYIESKIQSEHAFVHCKVPYTIFRPRGLFGTGDTSIVPRLLKANDTIGIPLFNNGNNVVDITCVENVAYAIRLAIEAKGIGSETYNLTNGEPTSFKDLVEALFKGIGRQPKYLKLSIGLMKGVGGLMESVYRVLGMYDSEPALTKYTIYTLAYSQTLNIDKVKRDLGYKPILSLGDGVKRYIDYLNESQQGK